ncbi:MAG: coiled-coil protein [Nitrososphaeraceae archaeon]
MNKTEEINALSSSSSEGINPRRIDHEQNIVSLESNLKTLLDFKSSLLEDQKNGEQVIQELNEKIEVTKKQIDEEREILEGLRIKLKEVNDVKEEEFPKFMELKELVLKARSQMKIIDEKTSSKPTRERINIKQLTKTLEQLERDIQIKKLSKEEERKLVARSKEIAIKLHTMKVMHKKEDQYRTISSQYGNLKSKINEIFDQRSDFGNKIGELKKVLDTLLDSREKLYEERRKIIRDVRETAAKLEMVNTQINAIEFRKSKITSYGGKRRSRDSHDKNYSGFQSSKDRARRSKENVQIWNSMKEQALKKMSNGEKLTFDEMRLIYSDINNPESF